MSAPVIGFAGLTHLGLCSAVAAACECECDGNVPVTPDDMRHKINAVERQANFH